MSDESVKIPLHELPHKDHYKILLRDLVTAIKSKNETKANQVLIDLQTLITYGISSDDSDNMFNQETYPGLEEINDFFGNPIEEWKDELPFLHQYISDEAKDERKESPDEDLVEEESLTADTLPDPNKNEFSVWHPVYVGIRTALAQKIAQAKSVSNFVDFDVSGCMETYNLLEKGIFEAQDVYVDRPLMSNLFPILERMKSDIVLLLEQQKKDIYENWVLNIIGDKEQFPFLHQLGAELQKPLPMKPYVDDENPEAMLLMLVGDADNDGLIEQAEAEVEAADTYVDSMKQQQKKYLLERYWDRAQKRKDELRAQITKDAQEEEKEAREEEINNALEQTKTEFKALRDLINEIQTIRKDNIAPHSSNPDALTSKDLEELQTRLLDEQENLRSQGKFIFDDYEFSEQRDFVKNLVGPDGENGSLSRAKRTLDSLIAFSKKELPLRPISEMTYDEMIDEMIERGIDLTSGDYGKHITPGRNRDLVIAYNKKRSPEENNLDGSEKTPEEKLESLTKKVELQLGNMDARMYGGLGGATVNREMLLPPKFKDSMIAAYSLNRSELLLATTYHAEMGPLIRSMLNNLVASGIEGKLRDVEATQAAGKVVHIKDAKYFNYNELSGEQGRDVLARGLDQMYPSEVLEQQIELEGDPDTKAKLKKELDRLNRAKKLAKLLFTNFDMLNIILGHNQFQTKTRAHNNGLSIDDPVAIENPVASYVHNGERYGGNPKDWRAWILPYFKRFPKNARLGAGGDPTRIRELQHSIILHQECFYDTDNFFGKVELPSMQYFDEHGHVVYPLEYQSFFPDTLDLVTLDEDETLELFDGSLVNNDGLEVYTASSEQITPFELYSTSGAGWAELLKYTFQGLPQEGITDDDIIEERGEGQKAGLLGNWLSKAGMMKVYPGPLSEVLPYMLLHYIYRLYHHYVGDIDARKELRVKIINELQHTKSKGGLDRYKRGVNFVISILQDDSEWHNLTNGWLSRKDARIEYMTEDWYENHPGKGALKVQEKIIAVENRLADLEDELKQVNAEVNEEARLLGDRTAAINYVKTHAGRLAILQAIDDLLPNYYELQTQYAKALKDRRGVKKPPVEVKGININPFKDADAVAYLSVVNADPDAVMPLPALRNGNMLAKEKH